MPIVMVIFLLLLVMTLSLLAGYAFGQYKEIKRASSEEKVEISPRGFEMTKPKKRKSRLDFGNQLDPVMPQGTLRDPMVEKKEDFDE